MPSGDRHLKLELILLPAFLAGYHALDPSWQRLAAFSLAYLAGSLLLSPDLDLHHNDTRRRWGVLGFIWIPYSKLFKHRGLSHSLVFGMITRLAYLTLVAGAALGGAVLAGWNIPEFGWRPEWPLLGAIAAGLYLPNILHVLYDQWDTSRKLRRARRTTRYGARRSGPRLRAR